MILYDKDDGTWKTYRERRMWSVKTLMLGELTMNDNVNAEVVLIVDPRKLYPLVEEARLNKEEGRAKSLADGAITVWVSRTKAGDNFWREQ